MLLISKSLFLGHWKCVAIARNVILWTLKLISIFNRSLGLFEGETCTFATHLVSIDNSKVHRGYSLTRNTLLRFFCITFACLSIDGCWGGRRLTVAHYVETWPYVIKGEHWMSDWTVLIFSN